MNFIKQNRFLIFLKACLYRLVSPWTPLALLLIIAVYIMFGEGKYISELLGVSNKEAPKNEVLKIIGILMGGILVAWQAWASHKRAKAMEDTAKAQADAVSKTEDGQRQERLRNAIEHLGNEKNSVRLGGAYELFHLAKDAKEDAKELRQTVLDILCAHIRRTTGESEYQKAHVSRSSEEIQSMLRLLFVQEHEVFKGLRIELQGSWLKGADLRKARLQGAILTEAYLQKAKLDGAYLQRANLVEAHMEEASLPEAHLQEANLFCVRMQGAYLKQARLQGTYLMGASLQAANLDDAYLQGADLSDVRLQGAYLSGVRLQGTCLSRADLSEATLSGAKLQGAGDQSWTSSTPFACRIRESINKKSDVSRLVFLDIEPAGVDLVFEGVSDKKKALIREGLRPHIGKPMSYGLPENSGAIIGAYTAEEAEQWIAEYEEAMSEVPKEDS